MKTQQQLIEMFMNQATITSLPALLLSLGMAAILGLLLGQAYIRFGQSLSNRRAFAQNFLLLTVTTTLVITIVQSSLTRSLGFVGVMSIARFRAAIKEPEELLFLFLAISVGLGLGAGQALLTIVAFIAILGLIAIRSMIRGTSDQPNLYVTVTTSGPDKLSTSQILEALSAAGARASLKRFDETTDLLEAAFLVDFKEAGKLEQFNQRLRELSPQVKVSCVDDRGLGA